MATTYRAKTRVAHPDKKIRRRPSVKGELKSGIAKKKAVRDHVKNPRARKALSKRHPRTPSRAEILRERRRLLKERKRRSYY